MQFCIWGILIWKIVVAIPDKKLKKFLSSQKYLLFFSFQVPRMLLQIIFCASHPDEKAKSQDIITTVPIIFAM